MIVTRIPGYVNPSLKKRGRDRIINPGSLYLLDYEDKFCNPYPRNALFTAAQQFNNLVTGLPMGTIFGANVLNGLAGKGIWLPGINDNGVDFGTSFDTAQSAVLLIIWLAARTADAPAAHSTIFSRCSSTGSGQYLMTGGADGKTTAPTLGLNGALATSVNTGGALVNEAPTQIAFLWNGDSRTGWKNGAAEVTNANVGATMNTGTAWTEGLGRKTTAGTTNVLGVNTGWKGSIHRNYKENVATAVVADGKANTEPNRLSWARSIVEKDFLYNTGRFS